MPEGFAPSGPDDAERAAARERLTRLEEAAAFSDRAIENLTEQMLDLDGKLRRAMARLAELEERIERVRADATTRVDKTCSEDASSSRPRGGGDADG